MSHSARDESGSWSYSNPEKLSPWRRFSLTNERAHMVRRLCTVTKLWSRNQDEAHANGFISRFCLNLKRRRTAKKQSCYLSVTASFIFHTLSAMLSQISCSKVWKFILTNTDFFNENQTSANNISLIPCDYRNIGSLLLKRCGLNQTHEILLELLCIFYVFVKRLHCLFLGVSQQVTIGSDNSLVLYVVLSWFENNPHFHKYSMDFHV